MSTVLLVCQLNYFCYQDYMKAGRYYIELLFKHNIRSASELFLFSQTISKVKDEVSNKCVSDMKRIYFRIHNTFIPLAVHSFKYVGSSFFVFFFLFL